MIVAIDGPSASGKSTIGRRLARHLRLPLVDSGLMYRAVTVSAIDRGIDPADDEALGRLARGIHVEVNTSADDRPPWQVRVDGADITNRVFDAAIAPTLTAVSQVAAVREPMVEAQRAYGAAGAGVVMVGRDIGTVVFPGADLKLYLDASPAERERRRREQMKAGDPSLLKGEISDRDAADEKRVHSPLRPAGDAHTIDTDGRGVDEVFQEILDLTNQALHRA